jgi:hypothetical protein
MVSAFTVIGLSAHKGHAHKIMGTISMIHENHVEIETKDTKKATVVLNDKTRILKATAKAARADLKEGIRVVVDAEGEKEMTAKTVRIGAAATIGR